MTFSPAAADTIGSYLKLTNTTPEDYDLILTGDLGRIGSKLLYLLLDEMNVDIRNKHNDCGVLIYDLEKQDVHSGGSGCGCSASVLCSHILPKMERGELNNVLFCATGALMSPTTVQQGEAIAGIAHIIYLKSV